MVKRRNIFSALLFLYALISFICGKVYAQEGLWKSYLAEYKNLPGPTVRTIAIDKNNIVWFGTDRNISDTLHYKGLASFDGQTWKQYNIDFLFPRRPSINFITVDKNNNKLICTDQGLVKYDGRTFVLYNSANSGLPSENIYSAEVDENNNIYLSIENMLVKFSQPSFQVINLPGLIIRKMKADRNGNLWIAGGSQGLICYNGSEIKKYNHYISPAKIYSVYSLDIDETGDIWTSGTEGFAQFKDGIFIYHRFTDDVDLYYHSNITCNQDNNIYLSSNLGIIKYENGRQSILLPSSNKKMSYCNPIISGSAGTLWFGESSNGAVKYENGTWTNYCASSGLPSNSVNCVVVDSNNTKWIGTSLGLAKLNGDRWYIYNIYNSSLPINAINTLHIDKNNTLWVGTSNGLAEFNGLNWKVYNTQNSNISGNIIRCITSHNDTIWVGTSTGLSRYGAGKWDSYNTYNSGLKDNFIKGLGIDQQGNKWIVSLGPVTKFDGRNWTYFYAGSNGWPQTAAAAVFIDSQNRKWFGCVNGIILLDESNTTFYNYDNTSMPLHHIYSITQLSNGNLVFGLSLFGGLVIFNNQRWEAYNTKLPFNDTDLGITVNNMAGDRYNNVWIASIGLYQFNKDGIVLNLAEKERVLPASIYLNQNYPNPFNGTTKLNTP